MLAFLPPLTGAPRPQGPEPRPGTAIGVLIAIILFTVGMLLPLFRPAVAPPSTRTGPPVNSHGG